MKRSLLLSVLVLALITSGCLGPKKAETFQPMDVSFAWKSIPGSHPAPEIQLSGVPSGTSWLVVTMTDLDMPSYNHGGGTVSYTGENAIPAGYLKNYRGPNPPAGERHRYRITVKALDSDKKTLLGEGQAVQQYP